MAAAFAADGIAARLSRQELEIRGLAAEIGRLKEPERWPGGLALLHEASPELQELRAENEKLRYRLLHLRRSLTAELARSTGGGAHPGQKQQRAGGREVTASGPIACERFTRE